VVKVGFRLVLLSLMTVKITHNQCEMLNWAKGKLQYSEGKFCGLRYSGKTLS